MMCPHLASVGMLAILAATPLAAQVVAVGKVTVGSGPHSGTYTLESDVGCRLSPEPRGRDRRFSMTFTSEALQRSRGVSPNAISIIHVDIPNVESTAGLAALQVNITFGDPTSRKTASTTYRMNTRPIDGLDTLMARHEGKRSVERKPEGRGGATLRQRGDTAALDFWAETATGVRIDGTIDCRQVDRY